MPPEHPSTVRRRVDRLVVVRGMVKVAWLVFVRRSLLVGLEMVGQHSQLHPLMKTRNLNRKTLILKKRMPVRLALSSQLVFFALWLPVRYRYWNPKNPTSLRRNWMKQLCAYASCFFSFGRVVWQYQEASGWFKLTFELHSRIEIDLKVYVTCVYVSDTFASAY